MYWLYLFCAIAFEVIGTTSLKQSSLNGGYFWVAMVILFYALSFVFLGLSLKKLDIGLAYAIWAGLGTVAITLVGYYFFQESMNFSKIFAIALIIFGTVMLKFQSN